MEDRERLQRIAERVRTKTENGELRWKRVGDSRTHFASQLGDRTVGIRSEDKDDVAPFRLSFYGGAEEVAFAESIMGAQRTEDQALNRTLAAVYRAARSDALGINQILGDLERELDL